MTRLHAPAAARNRDAILEVLRVELPKAGTVLEIASGTGEHAVHVARALAPLCWQPSDVDPAALASVDAYRADAGLDNLLAAKRLDVSAAWTGRYDAVVCINMIHIAPWACAEGLLHGASVVLSEGAPLVTYGPYRFSGHFTAESNVRFDASLRARDPAWGVRDVDDLTVLATATGFAHTATHAMPANNHMLVFRKRA